MGYLPGANLRSGVNGDLFRAFGVDRERLLHISNPVLRGYAKQLYERVERHLDSIRISMFVGMSFIAVPATLFFVLVLFNPFDSAYVTLIVSCAVIIVLVMIGIHCMRPTALQLVPFDEASAMALRRVMFDVAYRAGNPAQNQPPLARFLPVSTEAPVQGSCILLLEEFRALSLSDPRNFPHAVTESSSCLTGNSRQEQTLIRLAILELLSDLSSEWEMSAAGSGKHDAG